MIDKQENPYSLIFMDIDMPIMNGLDASKLIKEKILTHYQYNKALKIVFCSAYDSNEQRIICKSHGGDYYLVKPVSKKKLLEIFEYFDIPFWLLRGSKKKNGLRKKGGKFFWK